MKFNNYGVLKMGWSSLPIILVCIFFNFWLGCNNQTAEQLTRPKPITIKSIMIKWSDAVRMKNAYFNPATTPKPLKSLVGSRFNTLAGFQFDAVQISNIIYDKNWVQKADNIVFYLGTDGIVSDGTTAEPKIHLIAVGVKNDGTLVVPSSPAEQSDPFACEVLQSDTYPPTSQKIPWTQALGLIKDYKTPATNPHVIKKPDGSRTSFDTLQGLYIDAGQLSNIIYYNKSPVGKEADQVMIYFGVDGTNTIAGVTEPNMQIIAVGVLKGQLLIPKPGDYGNINKCTVSNHADPCPGSPGCPTLPVILTK